MKNTPAWSALKPRKPHSPRPAPRWNCLPRSSKPSAPALPPASSSSPPNSTALDADREAVRAAIDPDWLARFDRIAAARGTGIARAENQQCTGCRMGVRPQTWNQLREGELLTCDSCSRLLYWDPAMAPAPKAPQPEVIPGAGRAPRKPRQAGA